MFYVYQLRAETEELPFYIGKGKKSRRWQHVGDAKRGCKSLKCSKIRKYLKQGIKVLAEVIFESRNEQECFDLEVSLIRFYGRRDKGTGYLTNQTDGGEGRAGSVLSEEYRKHKSEIMKGRVRSVEHCQNISKSKLGHSVSAETRAKISASLNGRKLSDEHTEKLRISRIGKKHSDETKSKISMRHQCRSVSEVQKEQISKTLTGRAREVNAVDKGAKYSRKEACQHIIDQASSRLSQKQYCIENGIKEQTFCGWKRSRYVQEMLATTVGSITASFKNFTLIQRNDGFDYAAA